MKFYFWWLFRSFVSHRTVAIFGFPFVSQLETRLYYLLIPRFGFFSPDCSRVCILDIEYNNELPQVVNDGKFQTYNIIRV